MNLFNINEKLVVAVFGYEINLVDRSTRGQQRNIWYILLQFWFIYVDLEFKMVEAEVKEEDETPAGDDNDD